MKNLIILKNFKSEVDKELHSILSWWIKYALDKENGGFYGKINNNNCVDNKAEKGLVLNARILYTFSSAYLQNSKNEYLKIADDAFKYLVKYFQDKENGGFYWALDFKGKVLDNKKQIYGQAFTIYALSEYYKISQNEDILQLAKSCFLLIEKYSLDIVNHGYIEAFTIDWKEIIDNRLSTKDQNEKKSMNTHLHLIEAYANLFSVWPDDQLKKAIKKLLNNFNEHIIDKGTNHLNLFFTETWEVKSTVFSFGHDIEAAWLLLEAAEIINDKNEIETFKKIGLKITDAAISGLNERGGLWNEFDSETKEWDKEMHWWPQAEAMVGFYNAWQVSDKEDYLSHSLQSWTFIKDHLIDYQNGEWYWGLQNDYLPMHEKEKAGFWKCPYHNSRACLEIIKRIA
jgi:mannobiose 2-epimerase